MYFKIKVLGRKCVVGVMKCNYSKYVFDEHQLMYIENVTI